MPHLNRYHEAVRRALARERVLGGQVRGGDPVPLGREQITNSTWRARWERANPQEKKALRETLATKEDPMGVGAVIKLLGARSRQQLAPLEPAQEEENA